MGASDQRSPLIYLFHIPLTAATKFITFAYSAVFGGYLAIKVLFVDHATYVASNRDRVATKSNIEGSGRQQAWR